MRGLPFAAAIVALGLCASTAHADPVTHAWHTLPPDKREHVGLSAVFAVGPATMMFLRDRPLAPFWSRVGASAGFSLLFGLGKEGADELGYRTGWPYRHPGEGADPMDLAADVAGAVGGAALGTIAGHGIAVAVVPSTAGATAVVATAQF